MKKKIVVLLTGILAASMMLAGCEGSKGLETDSLKISQYKGVEVDKVSKPDEITDKDVEDAIDCSHHGSVVYSAGTLHNDSQYQRTAGNIRTDISGSL